MKNIIGDRNNFAIEYEINKLTKSGPMGSVKLWLNGLGFGDDCGDIYLLPTARRLKFFIDKRESLNWPTQSQPTNTLELDELYNKAEMSPYWLFYTEGFDDFYALISFSCETYTIFWAKKEMATSTSKINTMCIGYSKLKQIVFQFYELIAPPQAA